MGCYIHIRTQGIFLRPSSKTWHADPRYVGKSSKSLRIRDYKQHFTGTAGNSTIRKSLGCLLGFKLIPRDINSPQNGKTTFGEFDERTLTEWMKDNLLLFYYANNDYANVEKELIRTYNPPLNLQGNFNKTNLDFRKELSALRSCTSAKQAPIPNNQLKLNTYPQQVQCSNCGINLTIDEGLKNEEYIKCLSCGCIIQNPIYIQNKKNKERRQWAAVLIFLVLAIIFNLSNREYSTSSKGNNRAENYESNKEASQTEAMTGIYDMSTSDVSKSDEKIIGKWYDVVDTSLSTFYELYKKNGKTYLNYSGVRTVECEWCKIKGEEYVFRNEQSEIFNLKSGTFVYIGKNFEEHIDKNGNFYNSDIILLKQGNTLFIYLNDYDKKMVLRQIWWYFFYCE